MLYRLKQRCGRLDGDGRWCCVAGYPEAYFARLALPPDVVMAVISACRTGDVYNQARITIVAARVAGRGHVGCCHVGVLQASIWEGMRGTGMQVFLANLAYAPEA